MATSRRFVIAVFVIVLALGAATLLTASAPEPPPAQSAAPSGLSPRGIVSTPPLAPEVRTAESQSDGDAGRRLPTPFGFVGLSGLALALAARFAQRQRSQRSPVLALAFAHQGPRAPPNPVTFIR